VTGKKFLGVVTLICLSAALSACDQEEQGRILSYDKGTYLGPADQKLDAEQVRELETRTNLQAWY
jgi:hypothetical protein